MLTFKKLSELKPAKKANSTLPSLATLDGQTVFLTDPTEVKPLTVHVFLTATATGCTTYASGKRVNEQISKALKLGECDAIEVKIIKGKRGVTLE